MSTGYTHDVREGRVTDLRTFALTCARAMGPCVTLRDSPLSPDIPEFAVDTYHIEQQEKCQQELNDLLAATDETIQAIVDDGYDRRVCEAQARSENNEVVAARYDAMIAKVEAWEPPTVKHEDLKQFMLDQLGMSKVYDVPAQRASAPVVIPKKETVAEYREHREKFLAEQVAYHAEKHNEAVRVTQWKNEWVKALRESLPAPEDAKS